MEFSILEWTDLWNAAIMSDSVFMSQETTEGGLPENSLGRSWQRFNLRSAHTSKRLPYSWMPAFVNLLLPCRGCLGIQIVGSEGVLTQAGNEEKVELGLPRGGAPPLTGLLYELVRRSEPHCSCFVSLPASVGSSLQSLGFA